MISCFVPIEPQPWRRARKNGKQHFKDSKSVAYAEAIQQYIKPLAKQVTTAPVRLDTRFQFSIPESWPKYKREKPPRHTSRPDKDNLEKGIMDALNDIVWKDDAQVYRGEATKVYSTTPGIQIWIFVESEI